MSQLDTRGRILVEATSAFGTKGFDAVSLDDLADQVMLSKQTILYHFGSKVGLFERVIDAAVAEMGVEMTAAAAGKTGWPAVEAVVKAVFRIAVQQPAQPGLLREAFRLGGEQASRVTEALDPLIDNARRFLDIEMRRGRMRRSDPNLVMVSAYSTVMGVATEIEVLRAVGIEPTVREAVRRRRELLRFLKAALV